jgi:hypothetical protein
LQRLVGLAIPSTAVRTARTAGRDQGGARALNEPGDYPYRPRSRSPGRGIRHRPASHAAMSAPPDPSRVARMTPFAQMRPPESRSPACPLGTKLGSRVVGSRGSCFPHRTSISARRPPHLRCAESRAPRARFRPGASARAAVGHAPAPDELQASAGGRSEPAALPHPWRMQAWRLRPLWCSARIAVIRRFVRDEGWRGARPLCGAPAPSGWLGRMRSR